MEWFIPSLLVIVLSGIVCFVFLPKIAPYTLGMMAVAFFLVGLYQHYQTFPYEYSASQFKEILHEMSPLIMVLMVILGLVVGIMVAFGVSPPEMMASLPAPLQALPATLAALPASLPSLNLGGTPAKGTPFNLGGNAKRNNIASTSFKTV